MKFSSTSFVSLLVAFSSICNVSAGGHNVISVEPYLGEWCAAQFNITGWTGMDLAWHMKYRDYVRIEPILGNYCFDSFPGELADQKREATLKKMRTNHVQIEPYLMEWGMVQMRRPRVDQRINLERYIQEWCVKGQFRLLFNNKEESLQNVFGPNAINIEPTLGKWCFAEFKDQLQGKDENSLVAALNKKHIPAEDYLIKWEAADYGTRKSKTLHIQEDAISAGVGFAIALVVVAFFATCCWCWKRRNARKEADFQASVEAVERDGFSGTA